jgi:hypothetical protein
LLTGTAGNDSLVGGADNDNNPHTGLAGNDTRLWWATAANGQPRRRRGDTIASTAGWGDDTYVVDGRGDVLVDAGGIDQRLSSDGLLDAFSARRSRT